MSSDSDQDDLPLPSTSEARPNQPSSGTVKKTNPIWECFTKVGPVSGVGSKKFESVKCILCNQQFKHMYGNTSTYRRHLERKHYSKFLEFCIKEADFKKQQLGQSKTNQSKLHSFFKSKEKYGSKNPKNLAITKAIAKWMADSLHPYSIVEEPGFLKVLEIADEKIDVPTSTTYSRKIIPELYEKCLDRIKSMIEEEKPTMGSLSVTTDMWTSKATKSFLAVTVQFIARDFSLSSWCLACENIAESHTGFIIGEVLSKVLGNWGLNKQDFPNDIDIYCVTDNAANMRTALASTNFTHLTCFAHTLNLTIKDTKKDYAGFETLISKCRAIVGHFRHSSTAKANLQGRLSQLGLAPLELIQDVETRWNSEYLMMSRLLQVKDGLVLELSRPSCKVDSLTANEWQLLTGYVDILKPVFDATVAVSSEKKPTRSLVIPILYGLESTMSGIIHEKKSGTTLARTLLKCLKSRFPMFMDTQPDQICMWIDPRFKDQILPNHLQRAVRERVKKELEELGRKRNQQPTSSTENPAKAAPSPSTSSTSSLFSAFSETAVTEGSVSQIDVNGDIEIQAYLNETRIPTSEDPFIWWRANSAKYSLLAKVARKYLGIAATEVASERVFSAAGNVVTKNRSRLTAENTEQLVFLHQNLKNLEF